jgi:hypothetical protein
MCHYASILADRNPAIYMQIVCLFLALSSLYDSSVMDALTPVLATFLICESFFDNTFGLIRNVSQQYLQDGIFTPFTLREPACG